MPFHGKNARIGLEIPRILSLDTFRTCLDSCSLSMNHPVSVSEDSEIRSRETLLGSVSNLGQQQYFMLFAWNSQKKVTFLRTFGFRCTALLLPLLLHAGLSMNIE